MLLYELLFVVLGWIRYKLSYQVDKREKNAKGKLECGEEKGKYNLSNDNKRGVEMELDGARKQED